MLRRVWILLCALPAFAQQPRVITTFLGADWAFPPTPMPAIQAPLGDFSGTNSLAVDKLGNVFIADVENNQVYKVSRDGTLDIAAGNGLDGSIQDPATESDDGLPAREAALWRPDSLTVDSHGNLYFRDIFLNIRRVDVAGDLTTVATLDQFDPFAIDANGNVVVSHDHCLERIFSSGARETIAGVCGTASFAGDGGPATRALLSAPSKLLFGRNGDLFIWDSGNARIRKIDARGMITTVAGKGQTTSNGDGGAAVNASIDPIDVTVDGSDNLVILEDAGIRVVGPDGIIRMSVTAAQLPDASADIVADAVGNFYLTALSPQGPRCVWRVSPTKQVSVFAGGTVLARHGSSDLSRYWPLNDPQSITLDKNGNVYVLEFFRGILRVDRAGHVHSIPKRDAFRGMAVDTDGNVLVVDLDGLSKIATDGSSTRIAKYFCSNPSLAIDSHGTVAMGCGTSIVAISRNGLVQPIAGGNTAGFGGDGGPALNARFARISAVAFDSNDNLYIADDMRVRKIDTSGIVVTVAGNGSYPASPSPVQSARAQDVPLSAPSGLAFDSQGMLYVADWGTAMVHQITPSGLLRTVAGIGFPLLNGYGDGGLAAEASFWDIRDMAIDSIGNIFVLDGRRIREILSSAPILSLGTNTLSFQGTAGGPRTSTQTVSVSSSIAKTPLQVTTLGSAPWLRISPPEGTTPRLIEVRADPGSLLPGTYTNTIRVLSPTAQPTQLDIAVTFSVSAALPPHLRIEVPSLSFALPKGVATSTRVIRLYNDGGGTLPFTIKPADNWLSVSPAFGQISSNDPSEILVTANATGLSSGTYRTELSINGVIVPVTLLLSNASAAIQLTQAGLSFVGVAGGGVVPPQEFGVANLGSESLTWTASGSTLAGGNWFFVSPGGGTTPPAPGVVPTVQVQVNLTGLSPGTYYGLARIDSPNAANSPQVVTIALQVLPAGSKPAAVIVPPSLEFHRPPGRQPASQQLLVYNLTGDSLGYVSSAPTYWKWQPTEDFTAYVGDPLIEVVDHVPADGMVVPSSPLRVIVQPRQLNAAGFPGAYTSSITFQFDDGRLVNVPVTLDVEGDATLGQTSRSAVETRSASSACQPSKLSPSIVSLGQADSIPAGWAAALAVQVTDDCGIPLVAGSVTAKFSNGDQPVSMKSLNNGIWHGTWKTSNTTSPVVSIQLQAYDVTGDLTGQGDESVNLNSAKTPPVVPSNGVVSLANPKAYEPLSPGGVISIYGQDLATSTQQANGSTLPTKIGDSSVFIAGQFVPLYYAAQNLINAVVPYDINVNTTYQVVVRREFTYSLPVPVNIAPARPSLFVSTLDGTNPLVMGLRDGVQFRVSDAEPLQRGDVITLYCVGLGPVSPPIVAGTSSPLKPLSSVTGIGVSIGGKNADVMWAGLTPETTGLYQINAVVPDDAPIGSQVALEVSILGQTSAKVLVPIATP